MITLKHCISEAGRLGVPIIGDTELRGECKKEDPELASFMAWVRHNYPEYKNLVFHPENEMQTNGGASFAYHAKSKAKGRLDGLCDIVCLPISLGAPALLIELKRVNFAKSLANKAQKEHFLNQIMLLSSQKKHGAVVCVALGADNAKQAFNDYVEQYR
jgi:hypothetical protein